MFGKKRKEREFMKKADDAIRYNDELIRRGNNVTDADFKELEGKYRAAADAYKKTGCS